MRNAEARVRAGRGGVLLFRNAAIDRAGAFSLKAMM
jgi:hypothetical protein